MSLLRFALLLAWYPKQASAPGRSGRGGNGDATKNCRHGGMGLDIGINNEDERLGLVLRFERTWRRLEHVREHPTS